MLVNARMYFQLPAGYNNVHTDKINLQVLFRTTAINFNIHQTETCLFILPRKSNTAILVRHTHILSRTLHCLLLFHYERFALCVAFSYYRGHIKCRDLGFRFFQLCGHLILPRSSKRDVPLAKTNNNNVVE